VTQLPRTLEQVIRVPARLVRTTEFLFRRADASGDIYPDDDDHGCIPGPNPDRVVFLGEAGQISLGIRTHQLSLAAFFARHHHTTTRRGVNWSIHPFPHARLTDSPGVLHTASSTLEGADIVVLLIGITDALRVTPPATWEKRMRSTLTILTGLLPVDARILIAEMPPLNNAGSLSRPARIVAGIHGNNLNNRTHAVTDDYHQATAIGFPEELTRALWRPESDEKRYTNTYKIWAAHLAQELTDRL
jgi:hypothetical protein